MGDNQTDKYPLPFLRWAGGKRWLAKRVISELPTDFKSYYEPFLGAGTFFFAARPKQSFLSDSNEELILTYELIRDNCEAVLTWLRKFKNTKTAYYQIREEKPRNAAKAAARFIFLNKTCWNGLYRVNRKGEFNVPYGNKRKTEIYVQENLRAVSKALMGTELQSCDFQVALQKCKEKDFVYLDPPYTVAHERNGFLMYNAKIFSWDDQIRLSRVVAELHERGCYVLLSNAFHSSIKDLYRAFETVKLTRASVISGEVAGRGKVHELLLKNF